jgi:hypothetical protein
LELLALFAQHFHIQIAGSFDPILVDFDRQCSNQPQTALLVRKDSDDMGTAFELLTDALASKNSSITLRTDLGDNKHSDPGSNWTLECFSEAAFETGGLKFFRR